MSLVRTSVAALLLLAAIVPGTLGVIATPLESHGTGNPAAVRESTGTTVVEAPAPPVAGNLPGAGPGAAQDVPVGPGPLGFLENAGQLPNTDVRYYGWSGGLLVGFVPGGFLLRQDRNPAAADETDPGGVLIRAEFTGAAPAVPAGIDPLDHPTNFYLGDDPAAWRTGVRSYGTIIEADLYPGIDMVAQPGADGTKYIFTVRPDGDPGAIAIRYSGIESLALTNGGDLAIRTAVGEIRDSAPVATTSDGKDIPCRFVLFDDRTVGFACSGWDHRSTLSIDPLLWSTYLGAASAESGNEVVIDSAENAYVAGYSTSAAFPTSAGAYDAVLGGAQDCFISKISPRGAALLYSTYFGGDGFDTARSIDTDSSNNAYITGGTDGNNFPTTVGAYDTSYNGGMNDAFVAKFNSTGGALLYSTFLGGGVLDGGATIRVDTNGSAFIVGTTSSAGYPTTVGAYDTSYNLAGDAFVTELNAAGSGLVFSTFLGGTGGEEGNGLDLDSNGNVYVTGSTGGAAFPTTAGAYDTSTNGASDVFVTEFNAAGSALVYSTLIGGGAADGGTSIAVNGSGNAFVTGQTLSVGFPSTAGAYDTTWSAAQDVFVTELNAAGSALVYSTFLGDTGIDTGASIQVDAVNNAYVTGQTASASFPAVGRPYDNTLNGTSDAFVTVVNASGSGLWYSTFLGGTGLDAGNSIAVDPNGNATVTGQTGSTDFPTTAGAYDTSWNAGGSDAFVTRFGLGFQITVDTLPPMLQVTVNGKTAPGPVVVRCLRGVSTTVAAPTPQVNGTTRYLFQSWSDAGANAHALGCDSTMTLRGNFSAQFQTTVDTVPPGRQVTVNGTPGPQTFWCDNTSTRDLVVGSPQVNGTTRWLYSGWSDGGAQNHTITCSAPRSFIASFSPQYEVTVTTAPPGLDVAINGTVGTGPQTFWCDAGSPRNLSVSWPLVFGSTRHNFQSWSDGGIANHTVTCAGPATYTASFLKQHELAIDTVPPGLQVLVNGTPTTAPVRVWCDDGGSRDLGVPTPQVTGSTRFVFASWDDNGSAAHPVRCNGPTTIMATFGTQYLLNISTDPPGLQFQVDGNASTMPVSIWCDAGSGHLIATTILQGGSSTRHAFSAWSDASVTNHTVTCSAPGAYVAWFTTEHAVTVTTDPVGIAFAVDGTPFSAPHTFWCAAGSNHTVAVAGSIRNGTKAWVLGSWSDGGAASHTITCSAPGTWTATFFKRYDSATYRITVTSDPLGFDVRVNGTTHPAPYAFSCDAGSPFTIGAPDPRVNGTSRTAFLTWSDGGAETRALLCEDNATYTARMGRQVQIIVDTLPTGLAIMVDGINATAPATFWWMVGSTHNLSVEATEGGNPFNSWSDGGAKAHPVTVTTSATIVAYFQTPPKPTITIETPSEKVRLLGDTVVTGAATPGSVVRLRIDGGDWKDVPVATDGKWTYPLAIAGLKNGKHTIEAKAILGPVESDPATRTFLTGPKQSVAVGGSPFVLPVLLLVIVAGLGIGLFLMTRKKRSPPETAAPVAAEPLATPVAEPVPTPESPTGHAETPEAQPQDAPKEAMTEAPAPDAAGPPPGGPPAQPPATPPPGP